MPIYNGSSSPLKEVSSIKTKQKTLKILESYLYKPPYNLHLIALILYCDSLVDIVQSFIYDQPNSGGWNAKVVQVSSCKNSPMQIFLIALKKTEAKTIPMLSLDSESTQG